MRIALCFLGLAFVSQVLTSAEANGTRVRRGLQVLYDFRSPAGRVVKDRSAAGEPLDLQIDNPNAIRRSAGSLEVRGKTTIRSAAPPARVIEAVRQSGEITIEAWLQPASTKQSGPARIVTLSKNTIERNVTLGQENSQYDVRFRTNKTSDNGLPSISSPNNKLTTRKTHVVYARDRTGRARLYLDGKQSATRTVAGDTSNWDRSFRLALGNELTGDRSWQGTYFLVAIYSRALSPNEVAQNYNAGNQLGGAALAADPSDSSTRLSRTFDTKIAPLLAQRCLECHDTAVHKGDLDLSRRIAALAGGESGKVIVPGKSAQSLLWESIDTNEMPKDRPPLSDLEKKLLRDWIDAGAIWSTESIDPSIYTHHAKAGDNWLQRLTVPEYIETVRSAVGVDIEQEAREILPQDLRADGFNNTAYNLNVDLKHVEAYAKLAEIIVQRMDIQAFAARFSRSRRLTDDDMRKLITAMGKWLLRGPLEDNEVIAYRGISTTVASAGGDFEDAVGYVVEAMLQSPRFIYRMENQRGDGTAWPVGEYELASRLSYILWGGPPDQELMRAADAGELSDRRKLEQQLQRMVRDPRTIERSAQFIDQWLDLGRLENLQPDPKRFPDWDARLAVDMRRETLAFFKDVAWNQKRPLTDLLNAQVTFATPRLARHYGLAPQGDALSRYDLSSVPSRGGLLTQGSVLTVGGDEASMVTRGLFVLHDLLRGAINAPPPSVDTTPVPTKAGLTQRGIAESRIANTQCGACHVRFEPLAFGLEQYDGIGAFHDKDEHGNPLREDGEILFPGTDKPAAYQSAAQLMDLLAGSERVRECITWKVTQFALGRPLGHADAPVLADIHKTAQRNGGTYESLIMAVVMSDLVLQTRTEQDE